MSVPRLTRVLPLASRAVEFALGKIKRDDELLKLVHRSMYRTPGKATVIKKNIRAFSGFPETFEKSKTEELMNRAFSATLNLVLDLFDLPRGSGEEGKKESKVARIMEFLEFPKPSGKKDLKAAADVEREKNAEKREKLALKKERLAEKKEKLEAKKEREKAKKHGSTNARYTSSGAKAFAVSLPSDAAGIKAELEKMAARQTALLAKLEKTMASPKKRKASEKVSTSTPLAKKGKPSAPEETEPVEAPQSKMPDDSALEAAIKELLKGNDSAEVSMKKVRADLEGKFGVPLNEKKAKIKEFTNAIMGNDA
jgi:protein DEK